MLRSLITSCCATPTMTIVDDCSRRIAHCVGAFAIVMAITALVSGCASDRSADPTLPVPSATAPNSAWINDLRPAIAQALRLHSKATLLGLRQEERRLIINVSREFLALGEGARFEDAVRALHNAAASAAYKIPNIEYVILIEGRSPTEFTR